MNSVDLILEPQKERYKCPVYNAVYYEKNLNAWQYSFLRMMPCNDTEVVQVSNMHRPYSQAIGPWNDIEAVQGNREQLPESQVTTALSQMSGISYIVLQVGACHVRRKQTQEKTRSGETLIPFQFKLDTGTMLEAARKYVQLLQAQVHILECMPSSVSPSNGVGSAGTLHPITKDTIRLPSTSTAFGKGRGMSSNGNVKVDSLTKSLEQQMSAEKLCVQQMLHVLVT